MRLNYQMLLISLPLTLLAGSAPVSDDLYMIGHTVHVLLRTAIEFSFWVRKV